LRNGRKGIARSPSQIPHWRKNDLVAHDISQDATIQLVFSLEGGVKKKKKKQYSAPEKIKHKHKKYTPFPQLASG
jgi:hypothetical protein